jgi:Phage integrase, N-terminal SAM-like domain/Phage integrase family
MTELRDKKVWFPEWAKVLAASQLTAEDKEATRRTIIFFLHWCKTVGVAASITTASQFIEEEKKQGRRPSERALGWFFEEAQKIAGGGADGVAAVSRAAVPPPAALDLGAAGWEAKLVRAIREKGLLWRTEQTYRGWAARFVVFIAPQCPEEAGRKEVGAFLSHLAVTRRVAASTQRQAVNALVFLMDVALGRPLGEIDFNRSLPTRRVPVVLSRQECGALFAKLEGTRRLMAELAYGSGLRLLELLRLRVQDLDLARGRLIARQRGEGRAECSAWRPIWGRKATQRGCPQGGRRWAQTTQIYTHVMQRPGLGVRSPLDVGG